MPQTPRYGLPYLQAGQAQKEITHNDALARIDSLLHLSVESRRVATPGTTADTSWIVAPASTGDWSGHDGELAVLDGSGWTFVSPADGCIAYVRDESAFVHFATGQWRDAWTVPALTIGAMTLSASTAAPPITDPAGGVVVDQEARASLSQLLAALRSFGLAS